MRRTRKADPVIYVVLAALAVVILVAGILFVSLLRTSTERDEMLAALSESKREAEALEDTVAEQLALLDEYETLLGGDRNTINSLTEEAAALKAEAEALREEIALLSDGSVSDARQIDGYRKEIADLTTLLDYYQRVVEGNHGIHAGKITELFELIEKGAPDVRRIFFEDGEDPASSAETGRRGHVTYYYRDLATGYTIGCSETEVRYTASLIKAPYVYCILEEIAEFEAGKERRADGTIEYLPGEEKYDLNRMWTYDEATMFKEGSGEIQYMGDGTSMTYRELVEYTLLYSDNVAFAELRRVFGMDSFYQKVGELGITGTAYGFMQLSAEDCGKFLAAMYDFFETESEYALLMKDCMIRSMHNVMLVSGLWGETVAHKYGWDVFSYHDMGIVYGERPYVLVIMTDMEQGGDEVNAYVQKIVKLTHEIHTAGDS